MLPRLPKLQGETKRKERPMAEPTDYEPPKIWTWDKESGGRFANINRPIAGPTHDRDLTVGRHPLQLYSLGTPNGVQVTVMHEEPQIGRATGRERVTTAE